MSVKIITSHYFKKLFVLGVVFYSSFAVAQDSSLSVKNVNYSSVNTLFNSDYRREIPLSSLDKQGEFGQTQLMQAITMGNNDVALLLLRNGANPNIQEYGGETALHIAARKGNSTAVNYLLKFNAKTNLLDNEGWTPLMRAIAGQSLPVVEILVNANADIFITNNSGEDALLQSIMIRNKDIILAVLSSKIIDNKDHSGELESAMIAAKQTNQYEISSMIENIITSNTKTLSKENIIDNDFSVDTSLTSSFVASIPKISLVSSSFKQKKMSLPKIDHLIVSDSSVEDFLDGDKSEISSSLLPWKSKEDKPESLKSNIFQRIVDLSEGNAIAFSKDKSNKNSEENDLRNSYNQYSQNLPIDTSNVFSEENIVDNNIINPSFDSDSSKNRDQRPSYQEFAEKVMEEPKTLGVSEAILVPDKHSSVSSDQPVFVEKDSNVNSGPSVGIPVVISKDYYQIEPFQSENVAKEYWDRMFAYDEQYQDMNVTTRLSDSGVGLVVGPINEADVLANLCKIVSYNNAKCRDHKDRIIIFDDNNSKKISAGYGDSDKEYWIELGAFTDVSKAEYYWMFLNEDQEDLVSGLPITIGEIDNHSLGDNASSLRTGPFNNRDYAVSLCNEMRSRKIACFVP